MSDRGIEHPKQVLDRELYFPYQGEFMKLVPQLGADALTLAQRATNTDDPNALINTHPSEYRGLALREVGRLFEAAGVQAANTMLEADTDDSILRVAVRHRDHMFWCDPDGEWPYPQTDDFDTLLTQMREQLPRKIGRNNDLGFGRKILSLHGAAAAATDKEFECYRAGRLPQVLRRSWGLASRVAVYGDGEEERFWHDLARNLSENHDGSDIPRILSGEIVTDADFYEVLGSEDTERIAWKQTRARRENFAAENDPPAVAAE